MFIWSISQKEFKIMYYVYSTQLKYWNSGYSERYVQINVYLQSMK